MSQIAQSDWHDAPWLIDELVPNMAGNMDDIITGFENIV